MDRILRRELDAIARDNRSGAREIALRAVLGIKNWLRRCQEIDKPQIIDVSVALANARPTMAPLLRLANELALAGEARDRTNSLWPALGVFEHALTTGSARIALHFRRALARRRERTRIVTYSYSSTVLRALLAGRRHIYNVGCSEARPGGEGRRTAQELAAAGLRVWFQADAHLFSRILDWHLVVVGADAVLPDGFMNKVGTTVLLQQAVRMQAKLWVLTDTTKFWPELRVQQMLREIKKPQTRGRLLTLWPGAPRNVDALYLPDCAFEQTDLDSHIRFLTEKGWMTPAQVKRELKKIRISPRLKELID